MKAIPALIFLLVTAPVRAYTSEHVFSSGWCADRDYPRWAAGEKFVVGDTLGNSDQTSVSFSILVFKYEKQYNVERVTTEDYERCNPSVALYSNDCRETTITLPHLGNGGTMRSRHEVRDQRQAFKCIRLTIRS